MNDFETVREVLYPEPDTVIPEVYERANAALDRIEADRDELLARLGRMEGEYQAAPRMILERDAEVERLQMVEHDWHDRAVIAETEVEQLQARMKTMEALDAQVEAEVERLRAEIADLTGAKE